MKVPSAELCSWKEPGDVAFLLTSLTLRGKPEIVSLQVYLHTASRVASVMRHLCTQLTSSLLLSACLLQFLRREDDEDGAADYYICASWAVRAQGLHHCFIQCHYSDVITMGVRIFFFPQTGVGGIRKTHLLL